MCNLSLARFHLIFSIQKDSTRKSRKRVCVCCAAPASCSGREGRGRHTGPQSACAPRGCGWGWTETWLPSHDSSTPQTLERHRKANSSQSSAQHKPGLGAKRGLRKSSSEDQSVLPALEETAVAGAHHTLLSGGFHASRREAGWLAKQPCLLGYVLCLIPELLIMTGDLQLRPHPTGLARPVPDPGWWKGPESSSQPLPVHQAKPQTTSEDIQSRVQGELELVTGQFPDLTAQTSCVNLPLWVKAQATTRNGAVCSPENHSCS